MPKKVASKLSGKEKVLHPKSRKALKMTKHAKKITSREKSKLLTHMKQNQIGEKLLWLQNHLDPDKSFYTPKDLKELLELYLKRFDEELKEISIKHEIGNRKIRQHANREDIVKLAKLKDEEEYNSCGLEIPDILDNEQLFILRNWNGELRFLQNFRFSRYNKQTLEDDSLQIKKMVRVEKMEADSTNMDVATTSKK